jgi:hypothetical protein
MREWYAGGRVSGRTSGAEQKQKQDDQGHRRTQCPREDIRHAVTSIERSGQGANGPPPDGLVPLDDQELIQYF